MEYAYIPLFETAEERANQAPTTMLSWQRGTPPFDSGAVALVSGRMKYGKAFYFDIGEIHPVDLTQRIYPAASELVSDMREKLVRICGAFGDRDLDPIEELCECLVLWPGHTKMDHLDVNITETTEATLDEIGININAFTVANIKTITPGSPYT